MIKPRENYLRPWKYLKRGTPHGNVNDTDQPKKGLDLLDEVGNDLRDLGGLVDSCVATG